MDNLSILVAGLDVDHGLGRLCSRAFERLGHQVTYFDTTTKSVPLLGVSYGVSKMQQQFIDSVHATDPDLVFIIKGNSISAETIRRAREHSDAVFFNWNPDNPFAARSTKRRLEIYLDALPLYDVAFIWTEELFEELYDAGAQNVSLLPFAYDPALHCPATPDAEHKSDVVFAGHWSKKRQRFLAAVAELDIDLAIYGNYWKRKCFDLSVRRHVRKPGVFGEAYAKAISGADIAINVVANHNLDAWNMRTFEVPAIGTAMLTSETGSQRELFGDDGAEYFETETELQNSITTLLSDDQRRADIASEGRRIVEPHTYEKRMRKVIELAEHHH